MTFLTIEDLKKPTKRRRKEIELPGGLKALIQAPTEGEKAKFEDSLSDRSGKPNKRRVRNLRGLLIALCWIDPEGNKIMTEDNVFESWWQEQDGLFTSAFFREVKAYAGFDDDDFADIEDSAKNSGNGQA